jgi:hypothetical protein
MITIIMLIGCATTNKRPKSYLIRFPERTIKDWSPELAEKEAQKDIQNKTIKIYKCGTYASYLPGVSDKHRDLVKDIPRADAGIGCVFKGIEDRKLRKQQEI